MCSCSTRSEPESAATVAGATFAVEDMTCSHCVGTIRAALRDGMPGTAVSIDLETHRVTVDGDMATAAGIIREAGYEPVLVTH